MQSAKQVVVEYLTALSSHDVERVLACVGDDFVNEHTSALGSSSAGRETYRARLPQFFAQFESLHYEVIDVVAERERVVAQYRLTAEYDSQTIDLVGAMLFTVRDGVIVQRTDVWDSLTFLRQAGLAGDL